MKKIFFNRVVINFVLVLFGGLTAVSGLFLMAHYESHFAQVLHELAALMLLIFIVPHIMLNWRALKKSTGKKLVLCTVIIIICTALMAIWGEDLDLDSPESINKELSEQSSQKP